MAFFGVTLEEIERVDVHPNADRLSLAKMKGLSFQFVIGKDQFKSGDKVLYFPIDSILPPELIEKLGMTGKFSGKEKNRVKTLKLRNEVSQGFVCVPEKVLATDKVNSSSEEITAILGVTKYEPPVQMANDGILKPLPSGFSKYDIEGADRYGHIVDLLMDQDVVVMEKMEGTNLSAGKDSDDSVIVNQRNFTITEKEGVENSYWKATRDTGILPLAESMKPLGAIYGELCGPGIQDNMYKLKKHQIYVFDIKVEGQWQGFDSFKSLTETYKLITAPILFVGKLRDYLAGKTVQEASNGPSVVDPTILREGIVIKPLVEQTHRELGRLIIKQRSPQYLASSDN